MALYLTDCDKIVMKYNYHSSKKQSLWAVIAFLPHTFFFFLREKTWSGMQHYPAVPESFWEVSWHAGGMYHVLGCIIHTPETSSMNSDGFATEAVDERQWVLHLLLFSICWPLRSLLCAISLGMLWRSLASRERGFGKNLVEVKEGA